MDHSLVELNGHMSHTMSGTPRWAGHGENFDKTWSTGEENSCLENPMKSLKTLKDMTLKDELPRSVGAQKEIALREIAPEGMKRLSQSRNKTQLWMCLVVKVKSDAVKNSIA